MRHKPKGSTTFPPREEATSSLEKRVGDGSRGVIYMCFLFGNVVVAASALLVLEQFLWIKASSRLICLYMGENERSRIIPTFISWRRGGRVKSGGRCLCFRAMCAVDAFRMGCVLSWKEGVILVTSFFLLISLVVVDDGVWRKVRAGRSRTLESRRIECSARREMIS